MAAPCDVERFARPARPETYRNASLTFGRLAPCRGQRHTSARCRSVVSRPTSRPERRSLDRRPESSTSRDCRGIARTRSGRPAERSRTCRNTLASIGGASRWRRAPEDAGAADLPTCPVSLFPHEQADVASVASTRCTLVFRLAVSHLGAPGLGASAAQSSICSDRVGRPPPRRRERTFHAHRE